MRRAIGLLMSAGALGALVAIVVSTGCDSFPAACASRDDCAAEQLCQDGECLDVDPALLARCQSSDERCNGRDDDCDGTTDEGCAAGDECQAGLGICARQGTLAETPQGLLCSAEPGPGGDEFCNGVDDDCDGVADEVCDAGAPCFVGVGQCRVDGRVAIRLGVRLCVDDGVEVEPGAPGDEVCGDGIDNDCDGARDEGFAERIGQPCTVGVGTCANTGQTVCFQQAITCSVTPLQPAAVELCDRRDDDCDGEVDEPFDTGMPCTVGIGACQTSGEFICNQAQNDAVCSALPRQPADEVCDGTDNDCDGTVDEGPDGGPLTVACGSDVGQCQQGVRTCVDGVLDPTCVGEVAPIAEQCNWLDDDCDGVVDQFVQPCGSGEGACSPGTRSCVMGEWGVCMGAIGPEEETCNGADDDCDGVVDEAEDSGEAETYFEACGFEDEGECAFGVRVCVDGELAPCVGRIDPEEEVCDGLDNDCDGAVDEEYDQLDAPCGISNGDCVLSGVRVCRPDGGGTICDVELDPPPEECDAEDDDCDGVVDEDCGPVEQPAP